MGRPHSETKPDRRLVVRAGDSLIGLFLDPDSDDITYFASEEEAEAAITDEMIQETLDLAGMWSDLDGDEVLDALERIRAESKPTPPLER